MKVTIHAELNTELATPATLPAVADLIWELRAKRLEIEKGVKLLEAQEKDLKAHIEKNLPKGTTGVAGVVAGVELVPKLDVEIKDWPAVLRWAVRNKAWDLVQKRVTESVVAAWLKGKKKPAGVSITEGTAVSVYQVPTAAVAS